MGKSDFGRAEKLDLNALDRLAEQAKTDPKAEEKIYGAFRI